MMKRPKAVSPADIRKYCELIKANSNKLEFFLSFCEDSLLPILRHRNTLVPHYEQAIRELLQTVIDKVRKDNSQLSRKPKFNSTIHFISQIVDYKLPWKVREIENLKEQFKEQQIKIKEVDQNVRCLGCTSYFVDSQNVIFQNITATDAVTIKSALKLRIYKQELKQAICSLANSEGGVVLFDCYQHEDQIIPKGAQLTQTVKESIMQQIIDVCQEILPRFEFAHHVSLSFVPVIAQTQKQSHPLPFLEGTYVTRIRIWNQERQRLFFYSRGQQLLVSYRQGKKTIQLQGRAILKLLKKRFSKFYVPQQGLKEMLSAGLHCFQNHHCIEPEPGIKIIREHNKPDTNQNQYSLESQFAYLSKVTAGNIPVPKMVSFFIRQKISQFKFYPLKGPQADEMGLYLLFHDTSPHKLQELMSQIQGRPALQMLDHAVKISQKLNFGIVEQLYGDLTRRHKEEELRYYEFPSRKAEGSFLETGSKVSVMYLLLKLTQLGITGIKPIRLQHKNSSLRLIIAKAPQQPPSNTA